MEFRYYFRLFQRRLWLVILGALALSALSYIYIESRTPEYSATTKLIIGNATQSANPDVFTISASKDLVLLYAELAQNHSVLEATVETLDLPLTGDELLEHVNVSIVQDTSLIELQVTYSDPILAANIANELARQIILNNPTNLTPELQQQKDFLQNQINILNEQLVNTRIHLDQINQQLAVTTNQLDYDRLFTQRGDLVEELNQSSLALASFSDTLANLQQRTNAISIAEAARVPREQSGISTSVIMLLGTLLGGAVAAGFVVISDFLDESIKLPEQVRKGLEIPVMGSVPVYNRYKLRPQQQVMTLDHPMSSIADKYRLMQTTLLSNIRQYKGIYIITSPSTGEGKSATAANLAVSMALTGLRVLLIDANLRQPSVHQFFNIPNEKGLKNLLELDKLDVRAMDGDEVRPKIMVVEDDFDTRKLLNIQLEKENYKPIIVSSGHEALSYLENDKPALMILDLMLPDMHGFDVCQEVRKMYSAAELPILMLSALGDRSDVRVEGLQVGANDVLAKPHHYQELSARVRSLLNFSSISAVELARLPESVLENIQQIESVENLWVIPSGTDSEKRNPLALVSRLDQVKPWVEILQSHLNFDIILFDTPAVSEYGDGLIVAAATGGEILLVISDSRTKIQTALEAKEKFHQLGVDIKGVVINRARS
ncbi:MAG: response regulator [Anaerolineae bacterium]|nr:response regulator [Anaerolineae bacterium]